MLLISCYLINNNHFEQNNLNILLYIDFPAALSHYTLRVCLTLNKPKAQCNVCCGGIVVEGVTFFKEYYVTMSIPNGSIYDNIPINLILYPCLLLTFNINN